MASLKDVGERALIGRVLDIIRRTEHLGPGDDAACVRIGGKDVAVATDTVTFERHMAKGMSAEQFGWLAAAVNFSDIASMGAAPIGVLAAVSLPPETEEDVLYEIMKGIDRCAEFCGCGILGGDTKSGPGSVCGTALGICEHRVLKRSGARPGDLVAVTGALGSASAGWHAALNGISDKFLFRAVTEPVPRVKEGIFLASEGIATACMDISDGLSTTAAGICGSSGVGMDILRGSLPVGKGVENISKKLKIPIEQLVLNGGGEYELMFTFPEKKLDLIHDSEFDFSLIGKVTSEKKISLISGDGIEEMRNDGYEHFTKG